jgi:MerR family transcriptional regulator, light-induced transcriptional regulator
VKLKLPSRADAGILDRVRTGTKLRRTAEGASATTAHPAAGDADSDGGEPTLPVAAVARRLGVAPATLRTWDRRYGLGPSDHTNGKHRRYSPLDVARLEVMQRALLAGASTAEAAQYALDAVTPEGQPGASVPDQPAPRHDSLAKDVSGRDATATRVSRRLSAAALAMDARMVEHLLDEVIAAEGPATAWQSVITPVLDAVGQRWRGARRRPEVEHLLAELTHAAFVRATPPQRRPRSHPVLLAGSPDERPGLELSAVAAGLARKRVDPLTFRSPLPTEALVATVRRSAPAAVVLWARHAGAADPSLFTRLARGRQRSRLFALGPAWDGATLPPTVELLPDVPGAVGRIGYVLLGDQE